MPTTLPASAPPCCGCRRARSLLLLIGGVNLTNLLLIRAGSRVKELAVRQALGASRWHVVSEAMVETILLTLAGGALGLAAGAGGIRLLSLLGAERLPLGSQIAFDGRLAAVTLLGAVIMGLALAVPIAWFNLRGHLTGAIRSETRGATAGRAAQSLRHGFVVAQIALGLVLLAAAGLLARSLERAMAVSPGFRPDHVLTAQISVPWKKYPSWSARLAFNERLLQDIARQPGVSAAGIVNNVPLSGNSGKSAAAVKGPRSPARRVAARTLLLRSRWRLLRRHGLHPPGRTFPHRGRFAPLLVAVLRGRRGFRAILLASRQRSRPTTFPGLRS